MKRICLCTCQIHSENTYVRAPKHTNFPEPKINAVVRGRRIRIIIAGNLFGLYSELRTCKEIRVRSS